ncbi:Protein of unknown function (DUF1676) [Nesidiocoris tenuis]|nr:Protein of unknown function (DUF1676) [Nesidiocoris tenuis]
MTGRKKGGFGLGGALWAAGSVAAVGMAALAAMSGKALMTSMLALMLAGAGALRGGGGGSSGGGHGGCGKETQYIQAVHGRNIEYLDRVAVEEGSQHKFRPSPQYYQDPSQQK